MIFVVMQTVACKKLIFKNYVKILVILYLKSFLFHYRILVYLRVYNTICKPIVSTEYRQLDLLVFCFNCILGWQCK
jgi:hypothetical protein